MFVTFFLSRFALEIYYGNVIIQPNTFRKVAVSFINEKSAVVLSHLSSRIQ